MSQDFVSKAIHHIRISAKKRNMTVKQYIDYARNPRNDLSPQEQWDVVAFINMMKVLETDINRMEQHFPGQDSE